MHLVIDIHVEHNTYYNVELREGCRITLDTVSDELKALNAEVLDYYLDYDRSEVIIDIEPESALSMLVLTDHWLKAHIRKDNNDFESKT